MYKYSIFISMHKNFFHTLKVYYEDTDAGGVVYYANYLKFIERARTEALVELGFNNKKIKDDFGSLIIVKSCNIEFKISAKLEDELSIRSFVKSITKTSFFMSQFISRGEQIIAEAKVHLVFVNMQGKPMRIPDALFQDFKPYFCDSINN
jgi:acyl-CoA thioester hydrolase